MRRPLCVVCLLILIIQMVFATGKYHQDNQNMEKLRGTEVFLTGEIVERDQFTFLIHVSRVEPVHAKEEDVQLSELLDKKLSCNISGSLKNAATVGQTIYFRGRYEPFPRATNPGEFDKRKYNYSQNVYGRLTQIQAFQIQRQSFSFRKFLNTCRYKFQRKINSIYPPQEAGIVAAMLLGEKAELSAEIKELYKRNGILHILTISGLHIGLIGAGVYKGIKKLQSSRGLAMGISIAVLVFYGLLTGFGVSTARAIFMFILQRMAEGVKRTYDMLTAILISAVILLCYHQEYLFHTGFWLSFGCVLGIAILSPLLQKYIYIWPWRAGERTKLEEGIQISASIFIFTGPLQLWLFYELPLHSILVNLLILPVTGVLVGTSLISVVVPGLESLKWPAILLLRCIELVCRLGDSIPFAVWRPGRPMAVQLVAYYVVLAGMLFLAAYGWKKQQGRRLWIGFLFLCLSLLVRPPEARAVFLDVGQGDCGILETHTGEVYIFDCGSTSKNNVGEKIVIPYLRQRGKSHINGIFLSHEDEDHVNGGYELLECAQEYGITVEAVYIPWEETGKGFVKLKLIMEQGNQLDKLKTMAAGQSIRESKLSIHCLHPIEGHSYEGDNEGSGVYLVEYGEIQILYTGDVEGDGELLLTQYMEDKGLYGLELLKVAHHGSKNSTLSRFLEQCAPKIGVISCGQGNLYGHPHEELLQRLRDVDCKVLRIDQQGAIEIPLPYP